MRFRNLRLRDWTDLFLAQVALLRAQRLIRTRPRGSLIAPLNVSDNGEVEAAELDHSIHRVATAVSRAARYGVFRPNCLVRAVALQDMLRRRGFEAGTVRVGVRREAGGGFLAHAWVEYRGTILADQEWHVKKFDELARFGINEGST